MRSSVLYTYLSPFGFPAEGTGGSTPHIYGVINALETKGVDVITFPDKKEAFALWQPKKLGRMHRNNIRNLLRDLYILFVLNTSYFVKLLRFRHDDIIIYNRFVNYSWSIFLFAYLFRKKMINEINGPVEQAVDFGNGSILNPLNKILLRIAARVSKTTVCLSEAMANLIINYGIDKRKVTVYPDCVDAGFLLPADDNRIGALKKDLGIPDDDLVLGMVALFKEWHGLSELLEVLENYNGKNTIKLLLVGNPTVRYQDTFYELINRSKIDIIHAGYIAHSAVRDYIDVMDVCVELGELNSYGSPLKLIEYGSRGKLVIFRELDSIKEMIRHGENGLLVNNENMNSVVLDVIDNFNDNNELYQRMAQRFQDQVHSKYTWEKYIEFLDEKTGGILLKDS